MDSVIDIFDLSNADELETARHLVLNQPWLFEAAELELDLSQLIPEFDPIDDLELDGCL